MGDKIQGDVGDDGRNVSVGKGNQQADQRVVVNVGENGRTTVAPTLPSVAKSLERLERFIDGDPEYEIVGMRTRVKELSAQVHTLIIIAVAQGIAIVGLVILNVIQLMSGK